MNHNLNHHYSTAVYTAVNDNMHQVTHLKQQISWTVILLSSTSPMSTSTSFWAIMLADSQTHYQRHPPTHTHTHTHKLMWSS